MGCFGYICKGCNTQIVGSCFLGGENTVLIHVRHGKELGRVTGHYDEYGRVKEQENLSETDRFRGDSDDVNGHREICKSEANLDDSYSKIQNLRMYNCQEVDFSAYIRAIIKEEMEKTENKLEDSYLYNLLDSETIKEIKIASSKNKEVPYGFFVYIYMQSALVDMNSSLYDNFKKLERAKRDNYSGIVAWHVKCYEKASLDDRNDLTPSKYDPNQSWGKVRDQFI